MGHMWQWIVCNSAGIQALAALVGLIVLSVYTFYTSRIRRATSLQAKDNLIAFLALHILPTDGDPSVLSWKLQNQGSGTAINIRVWLLDDPNPKQRPSLMKGDTSVIVACDGQDGALFAEQLKTKGFRAEYESLAGERFRSTFRIKDKDTADVSFENLSRQ